LNTVILHTNDNEYLIVDRSLLVNQTKTMKS